MNGPAMRFLLLPFGSAGDLHPFLAVGCELRRRGHEVRVASNPVHRFLVESHGLDFFEVGTYEEMHAAGTDPSLRTHRFAWKVAVESTPIRQIEAVHDWIESSQLPGRTVVVAQSIMFAARIARETLGVPLATIHLEPGCFRSVYRSPVMPPPLLMGDWVPRFSKECQLWIADRFFIDPVLQPVNEFRSRYGLSPVRRFMQSWWHSPDLILGLFPEWYAAPQPDWPGPVHLTGFVRWNPHADAAVDAELSAFLDAGDPPIVFTAGSAGFLDPSFFSEAVDAARRLGRRAILLSRRKDVLPASLPESVKAFSFIPFERVLPRSACLVHHGGIGTVAQALAAGVPQLVTPVAFNQPDEAARLERFGVGDQISPQRFTGQAAAEKLERLLNSPRTQERCRELAANFVGRDPLFETCDRLEDLLRAPSNGARPRPAVVRQPA